MAPITCQILDSAGRGIRGVQVTLHCDTVLSRSFLTFESITDEDGGISMWFNSGADSRFAQLQPRLLDTSLLHGARLTLLTHPSNRSSGPQNMVRADLQLLSDLLPAVKVHLDHTPRIEYMTEAVASPVNEWYQDDNQPPRLQAVSPLQLPAPLVQPNPAAAHFSVCRKRKRVDEAEEGAEKRTRMV
ncbi:hypothetical protein NLG97_g1517 [Lecanicillium saksenae]|uniref:Uncharacterized protein n=1 Tax=Lecanicillium saksenae TaxID=468837 RepID=A0ACC1R6U1_9HYPO|nr:hypothetical protein NLG97_g1517 [Lecanicillium saksenae]